jgi:hypothetical protein
MEREPNPIRGEPPTKPAENTVAPDRHPDRNTTPTPATEPTPRDRSEQAEARDDEPLCDSAAGPRPPGAIPPQVVERFLRVDNEYYFPDRTLAFIDHGTKLTSRTNNAEVVRSLVAIAQARGWTALRVTGAAEFRQQVWREATLRGLEVRGYDPSDVEREDVRRTVERQAAAREGELPRDPAPPGGQDREATADRPHDTESPRIRGHLVEAGPAPYKFDPKNGLSYYVKLHTDEGERVLWGVDLERALAESSSRVAHGDEVIVQSTGSRSVTLKVPKHDSAGRRIGTQSIQTHRNGWIIERPIYFNQLAERAAELRSGANEETTSQPDPALAKARLSLWLGEQFAAARIDSATDRERFMAFLKEALARAIERGEDMPAPKLTPEAEARLRRAQQERAQRTAMQAEPMRAEPEREAPPHVRA